LLTLLVGEQYRPQLDVEIELVYAEPVLDLARDRDRHRRPLRIEVRQVEDPARAAVLDDAIHQLLASDVGQLSDPGDDVYAMGEVERVQNVRERGLLDPDLDHIALADDRALQL